MHVVVAVGPANEMPSTAFDLAVNPAPLAASAARATAQARAGTISACATRSIIGTITFEWGRASLLTSRSSDFGRHLFGAAAAAAGLVTLAWHADGTLFVYVAALAQIAGGVALQFRPAAKAGAAVLSVVYLAFAVLYVPRIIAKPQVYDRWGNFFEQFSLFTGAAIVYARRTSAWTTAAIGRVGAILFGICVASFTIEQAVYLGATATLVPKWLPPNQTFWAVATTVFFALGAVALLVGRRSLLSARMLTVMLLSFGIVVWIPLLLLDPHSHANWSETAETFGIAGSAWILADLLTARNG